MQTKRLRRRSFVVLKSTKNQLSIIDKRFRSCKKLYQFGDARRSSAAVAAKLRPREFPRRLPGEKGQFPLCSLNVNLFKRYCRLILVRQFHQACEIYDATSTRWQYFFLQMEDCQ
jgi:hypothetical protein